ncbi:ubiquinol oxidase, subunit II [Gluconacetobacter diazotrophicus PA1 5]|nr:ubiquinol oxidase subunit II [Gluconacetobacter diazotrophicus]ACI50056.1 ubiquinol oxidase, subunit II [Gluconacetobacter diazotrophicus PA1 5]MBB2156250.1 ubiquinol oxidase subunit II [Gluconacetobacter diazotrophicus]TWB07864.1 cytochrome bo3 quinol oxidase subunit 2 [Gluconacetobacter diazotrophicus]
MKKKILPRLSNLLCLSSAFLLAGCDWVTLNPKGVIGVQEKSLILSATYAMLLVVVPVIVLTLLFAWQYRQSNTSAEYLPKWAHSNKIEVVIWLVPSLIILFLAVLTYQTCHSLDPYRPIDDETNVKPIHVDVVALDWKWLFIYPDEGIATVNQMAFPVNTPVDFRITSDSVMNSFFIPQLGSQVYAMAGMRTQLHLIANEAGNYLGESANFSGRGFSDMQFRALAMSNDDYNAWVQKVKASSEQLDGSNYPKLAAPSEKNPVEYFSHVSSSFFDGIVAKYNNGMIMDEGTGKLKPVQSAMSDMNMKE